MGADPDYPLIGETLGLWRLEAGLGRGGMGEVYKARYDYFHLLTLHIPLESRAEVIDELAKLPRAEHARLASEMLGTNLDPEAWFAIKVCSARHATAGYRRFLQEAALAQRLGVHPNIVTVHAIHAKDDSEDKNPSQLSSQFKNLNLDSGKHKEVAYMVMDLAACDYDHTQLTLAEAVQVVRGIASALDHAHRCGVVHRDLKPENILGSVDNPLLTDFGIAKEIDHSLGLTRTGQVIGTLDYMSQEQATDAKSVDHRSDVYSLGVVMYEFTTRGKLPYLHLAEREAALAAIRSEAIEPKWPRQHDPRFPRSLERVILKAMAHRQEDRYQEMSAFIADIDEYLRDEWLSPWGRIRFRRWLRYLKSAHPKFVKGLGIGVVVAVLLWVILLMRDAFDTVRQGFETDLQDLRVQVEDVVAGRQQQIIGEDRVRLVQELGESLQERAESYPELQSRFMGLRDTLQQRRWLRCVFSDEADRPVQAHEGKRHMFAAVGRNLSQSLTDDGMLFLKTEDMIMQPYGKGVVYVNILLQLPDSGRFEMVLGEAGPVQRNKLRLRVDDGRLQLFHERDEERGDLLYNYRLQGRRLDVAVEISDKDIRYFLPGTRRLVSAQRSGLRQGHPAQLRLVMPAKAVLKYLEILPRPLN